jgi:2-dehydro-3-deoxyphosphogluconate aldolase/(4S)-4-hydroxy-2-oxoglutarate aldolase
MSDPLTLLGQHKVVPVIALESAADAVPLAQALIAGGLPVAEVTFRTAAAEESIRAMAKLGGMVLGAGTVLNVDTVKRAVDAGATYIVSPGINPKVVEYCVANKIPVTPGTVTPTEIEMALEFGLKVVKFFPAEVYGGLKAIKALSAPYTGLKFMPTGGVSPANLAEFLAFKQIHACGGSWMVAKDLIAAKDWGKITALSAEAVGIARSA